MKPYLNLLEEVLTNGTVKGDRTGTGTISQFACQYRINLANAFPLLTTKKVSFKAIAAELLWFLSGDTNNNTLKELGVNIWNEWATEDGSLGPIYGQQWTAWPTRDGQVINQIDYVVDLLKNNPDSRRILFHGWNVEYLPDESVSPQQNVKNGKMALPPCHLLYQFYVANNCLSVQVYLRSNDLFLGSAYNVASAALLVHMLAQQCDLEVGEVIMTIGDAHIYSNHIEQAKTQLARAPRNLPQLVIKRKPESIYDYCLDDFDIIGYDPHPAIRAPVAI